MQHMTRIVNSDPRTAAAFVAEKDGNLPYQGFSAYTDSTWVALFRDDDGRYRVDVYNEDGDTLFSRDLTDLPFRVAAAWLLEALDVRP